MNPDYLRLRNEEALWESHQQPSSLSSVAASSAAGAISKAVLKTRLVASDASKPLNYQPRHRCWNDMTGYEMSHLADSRRAAPVSFASHGPAHSTGYVPSTSTSNIPYDEDQTFKLNGTKNSLDAKSVPTFKPKKGLITYYKYSQTLNNLIATQGPRFDNCHAYLVGIITASFERSQLSACNQFLRTVQNELIELSPLCARPLQSYLQGNTMIATGKDSYSQRILGGVDKLESSPSSAFRTERFHQPYPPGPHQFLQAWALVTHRHLSQPLQDEYRIWSANLKMGVSNSIDVVPPEEGVREFAERVLQVYDLFNMADPLMFAQELERYPTLHVFKAGLPEDYSPHITKILQELGVRTMDRDQQLMHIITKLQNYHEFVISVKHDNSGVTSTPGRNAHSSSAGHHTPSPPQAQETGYTRPLRRAFPAAHVTMLDVDVHDVPVHDAEYAHDTGTSYSQIPVDNDDQERAPSLQEELVEVHAHATFPSTMHPRGNPRPPLPPSAGNSYQQRPPGSTGAPGLASTSRPTGAPSVGTTYQPNKMVCDICSETHWTRNCPRYAEAMSVYKKHLQSQGVNPRDPAPIGSAHFTHAADDSWLGFSPLAAHDSSPPYLGGGTSNK
ncbi:hypothetical protein CEUSTIGMA_g11879.t1 [Chlamydomonas eustigma]|uniref:Uncharacterized protein n=1 Tax=Chlamydomonas eustigma TaxID=1157962 RepID=A0A250XND2_9CHLO|nr:hypothetical protein CEUSTIGMA_g11879.t1 [Chlamydomonas eustigma]|eukprot:GAX84459.1 hypothetical protein CEUSTIGMA_g11879.t1 [Chlamydomonas eustigma]